MNTYPLRTLLAGVAIVLVAAGSATAQVRYGTNLQDQQPAPAAPAAETPEIPQIYSTPVAPRYYGGVDYLFWWMKSAPLPLPIITAGEVTEVHGLSPMAPSQASIIYGSPYPYGSGGQSKQNFPGFNGLQIALGGYLDRDQRFGLEGSAFLFEHKGGGTAISSASGYNQLQVVGKNTVAYGFVNSNFEDGLPVSIPGVLDGHVELSNSLRLWGAAAVGSFTFFRGDSVELTALGGFRYLDLYEAFNFSETLVGVGSNIDTAGNLQNYTGEFGTLADRFQTRNQFYGGTLGLRTRYNSGSLSIDASARVSLGSSHDVLNVAAFFTSNNFPMDGQSNTGTQGFYAQPANAGRTARNVYSVVPEAQIKVSYAFTSWLRASVGYNYLYWTNVVRPGDQIDRNVPVGQTFQQNSLMSPTPIVSATSPSRFFNLRDFYANGLNFSLEFRY